MAHFLKFTFLIDFDPVRFIPYILGCITVWSIQSKLKSFIKQLKSWYIGFKKYWDTSSFIYLLNLEMIRDQVWVVEDHLKLLKHFTYFKIHFSGGNDGVWKMPVREGIKLSESLSASVWKWWRFFACTSQSNWKLLKCFKWFMFPEEFSVFPSQSTLNFWISE